MAPKSKKVKDQSKAKGKNKANGKAKKEKKKVTGKDFSKAFQEMKKKPSKADLKLVLEALKKDADLIVVRRALKYVPHYLKSEGLTKKLLVEIIKLWSESSEKIRVICLLCLIRIYTKLQDKDKKQMVIKKLYQSFLDKCRVTKHETMSMIGFMRHSLVELYKIDSQIAFKQAQTSCQQLVVTLKNALTHKNEETYKTVLSWQFANCLILLSQVITSQEDNSPVRTLAQQVIQLNLGAINLMMSPRYYPYYSHLIENLIHLSISTQVFIPILPLILAILKRIQFSHEKKKDKKKDNGDVNGDDVEKETKEYEIDLLNHVSLNETQTTEYNVAVLDKLYDITLLYLSSQCHRIAFPELVFLPCVQLKKWIKKTPPKFNHRFKTLLEKIKADCEKIEEARRSVNFGLTDNNAVDAWEKRMKDSNVLSLPKLLSGRNNNEE